MSFSKIHFNNDYWTDVDIKCETNTCNHTRTVKMYYPDELCPNYWAR